MQHDEATVEYYNAMEQMEAGFLFLRDNFGVTPHVGWQLDPFGYSAVTPTLLAEYGFDTLFITRVGSRVKQELRKEGQLQFIWRGHDHKQVLVHAYQGELYTVTNKIHYDVRTIGDTCMLTDLENENLECLDIFMNDVVYTFMNTTDNHARQDDTEFHIPALFGDDFAYSNASYTFSYIDTLGKLLRKHSK